MTTSFGIANFPLDPQLLFCRHLHRVLSATFRFLRYKQTQTLGVRWWHDVIRTAAPCTRAAGLRYHSIFKRLAHGGSFCSATPSNSFQPLAALSHCPCQNSATIVEGRRGRRGSALAFLTRSKGLQVAEKTRLITSSGTLEGGDDTRRDESSKAGRPVN